MVARNYNTVTKALSITATSGGASGDLLYTCPPNHDCEVDFLHISNGDTAVQNVTLQWYHAETATYHHILNDKSIAGKDVYNVVGADRLYLHSGDKLVCFNGGATLEAFMSGKEFFNPTRS